MAFLTDFLLASGRPDGITMPIFHLLYFTGEYFWIFSILCTGTGTLFKAMLHLPPLRFHCVGG
jgi:hypothetical protein